MIELMTKTQFKDLFEIMDYSFPRNERRDMDEQLALFDDGRYKVACQYGDDGKLRAFMAYWELDGVTYADPTFGTYTYDGEQLASCSYGAEGMPVVEGYTYAIVYEEVEW